jgi:signal peptidase
VTTRSELRSGWRALRRGVSWGVLALVAGLAVLVLGIPLATGSTPLAVLTPSMEPALPPGTLVVVRPTAPEDVHLGDVLTYQMRAGNPDVVSHRVVEIHHVSTGELEFVTQGDNNAVPDSKPVTTPQIKGTVWYSVPFVGWTSILVGTYGDWLAPLAGGLLLVYGAVQLISGTVGRVRRTREASPALPD